MDIFSIINELERPQIFRYHPRRAVVNMTGPDARDFLQRMSTNDMATLAIDHPVQTCLLNNKGRLIDYLMVIQHEHETFTLLSSFPDGQRLVDFLEHFHFVEDFALTLSQQSPELLIGAGGALRPSPQEYFMWRSHNLEIFMSLDRQNDYPLIDTPAWECLRIAALMPEIPGEINEGLMPQNVGLGHLIADNKGCYVGQEVIAKAITYQKNVKSLAGVKMGPENFALARVGDRVSDQLGNHGVLTSKAPIFCPALANGLALLDNKPLQAQIRAEFIFSGFYTN